MLTTSPDRIIERIRGYSELAPIVVEGKNDVASLNELGIFAVVSLNAHGGPVDTVDFLAESGVKEIIILTDFDRRGEELHRRIAELANSAGIRVNDALRKKLREVTHVKYVENLARIVRGEKIGKNIH